MAVGTWGPVLGHDFFYRCGGRVCYPEERSGTPQMDSDECQVHAAML